MPPQGEEAPAAKRPPKHEPQLSEDEVEFVRALVIHEDPAAIVVNKPPGLATQGGTKTKDHLDRLLDGLADDGAPRPKLVHRLDKDTSGVLLVARTPRAAAFFSKSFSGRTARKVYWAIVIGVPAIEDGLIDLPLAKQPGTGGEKMHVEEGEGGQPARTRYRVIERAGNRAAWVELQPLTGRTHQLRVHMSAIGHPILGDGKYGGQDAFLTGAISRKLHLHARRLRIDHPDGGRIDVTAELPEHFAATMASLGFDPALGDLPLDEVEILRDAGRQAQGRLRRRQGPPQGAQGRAPLAAARLMHPNRAFAWEDREAMLALVARGRLLHDLRRRADAWCMRRWWSRRPTGSASTSRGATARPRRWTARVRSLSCLGPDAYISPDWYGTPDQVPTWNYLAVEAEGPLRRLDEDELTQLLDDLSAEHEARLAPKPAWTRAKMSAGPVRGDAEGDRRLRAGRRGAARHQQARPAQARRRAERRRRRPGPVQPRACRADARGAKRLRMTPEQTERAVAQPLHR